MLLSDAILKYEEYIRFRNLSKNTINAYNKELKYLLEYLREVTETPIVIDEITLKDLEEYIKSKKEKGNELTTINRSISIIKIFFNFLKNREILEVNPSINIETYRIVNKNEREVLTEQEIEILIEKIDNPTVRYAVETMANTGLRISELTNLKLIDVNFKNRIIRVINGKGGKNRIVPINRNLYKSLKKYMEEIRPEVESDYFFATEKTGRWKGNPFLNKFIPNKDLPFKYPLCHHFFIVHYKYFSLIFFISSIIVPNSKAVLVSK